MIWVGQQGHDYDYSILESLWHIFDQVIDITAQYID